MLYSFVASFMSYDGGSSGIGFYFAINGFTSSLIMTSLTWLKKGNVTAYHSYLRLSALADYAKLVGIYSISDNCVLESTLWLSD